MTGHLYSRLYTRFSYLDKLVQPSYTQVIPRACLEMLDTLTSEQLQKMGMSVHCAKNRSTQNLLNAPNCKDLLKVLLMKGRK